MFKRFLPLVVSVGVLAAATPATAATTISITASGFQPAQATIGVGDTVTWRNNDTANHQVVSDGGRFSSPVLTPGQSYSFRFSSAGTFPYHDGVKPTEKGTITVRPTGRRTVTIAAAARSITYGSSVRLSGSISTGRANETVVIRAQPYRGQATTTTAVTDADGTWELSVRPQVRTEYTAQWGPTMSEEAPVVYVRPRVSLRAVNARSGIFSARVSAAVSYQGKTLVFQRRVGTRWVKVRRVVVGARSTVRFRARLPHGTLRLRVVAPPAPGYLTGFSGTLRVRR
jgi:plastocyanin